jgi:hypothetical protein
VINIGTPALLFPALSLLMLAYTNRFLTIANLIRKLHDELRSGGPGQLLEQIRNLQKRIRLIKAMQIFGVLSLLLCVLTMFLLFVGGKLAAEILFALSLAAMIVSLVLSLRELFISVDALNVQLSDLEEGCSDRNA